MTTTKTATGLPDFVMVKIADIDVSGRYRAEPAKDLDKLRDSMDDLGLLQPIVIAPKNGSGSHRLVAGARRILAAQKLGWDEIEAHIIHDLDEAALLLAEHNENECRIQFTAAERRAVFNARKEILNEVAKANSEANLKGGSREGPRTPSKGKSRDVAAKGLGTSGKTLERETKLEDIANDESQPEELRELAEEKLDAVDSGELGARTALEDVQTAAAEAEAEGEYRRQAMVLKAALTVLRGTPNALTKQTNALKTAFAGVDNFDHDCDIDTVAAGFKEIRTAIADIRKVCTDISAIVKEKKEVTT